MDGVRGTGWVGREGQGWVRGTGWVGAIGAEWGERMGVGGAMREGWCGWGDMRRMGWVGRC